MSELHISQDFCEHQARPILTPYAHGEVLLKTGIKLIFPVFFEELLHATMWLRKKFVLLIESWFFTFFHFFFAHGFA
jgi:uncharacterized membrane protein SirB2